MPLHAALRAGLQLQGYDPNELESQVQGAQSAVSSGIAGAQSAIAGLNGAQSVRPTFISCCCASGTAELPWRQLTVLL